MAKISKQGNNKKNFNLNQFLEKYNQYAEELTKNGRSFFNDVGGQITGSKALKAALVVASTGLIAEPTKAQCLTNSGSGYPVLDLDEDGIDDISFYYLTYFNQNGFGNSFTYNTVLQWRALPGNTGNINFVGDPNFPRLCYL